MSMFSPDLFRHFGIGFLIGAIVIALATFPHSKADLSGAAQAATSAGSSQTIAK